MSRAAGCVTGLAPGPLDIAVGMLIGTDPTVKGLREQGTLASDPVHAIEDAVRSALARPPCMVSFSGGRDSSVVLAMATGVARREGWALPVPVTIRYLDSPATDETAWQEVVVGHLGLVDWLRVEIRDELEGLGPVATGVLRHHGLLFPHNAYAHLPLFERARGGSFLTGAGGDELFGSQGSRVARLLARQVRPVPRDALRLMLAASPRAIRSRIAYRRLARERPWLWPEAEVAANRALARSKVGCPERWDRSLDAWWRSRQFQATQHALATLAASVDVRVVSPFMTPHVMASFAAVGGAAGFPGRTQTMERFFAGLLPPAVLTRGTKAVFTEAIWKGRTRAFVSDWDGTGIDSSLVDEAALRRVWASDQPDSRTLSLLQSVWLAQHARSSDSSDT